MAEEERKKKKGDDEKEKEMKIPVFSVVKNGTVVKNIFLNNPQWQEDSPILIGRHPDCHIALDHWSISPFHLEMRSKPASLTLTVTDISSVHGTWVSGNKIEPNIPVDLMEGDTVKLGTSTRIYQLHWIPLSTAFEMENTLPWVLKESGEFIVFSSWPLRKELEEDRTRLSSFVARSESVGPPWPMKEENRTPEKNFTSEEVQYGKENPSPLASEKRVASSSLFSRRSKSKSVSFLHIQTGRNKPKNGKTICDGEAEVGNQEKHGKTICDGEADVGEHEKNGTVTEHGKREETFCRVIPFQSLLENSPSRNSTHLFNAKRTVEKESVPFQSLMEKSPLRNSSPVECEQKLADEGNMYSSFSHTHTIENELHNSSIQGMEQLLHKEGEKKRWNILVDTGCFLNKESLKSLQLLEGVKGTHLIVPRLVIRELDCLKRHESLFRRDTRAASSVLQWIEGCMVKCSWWIHVQSSSETLPVAPTPSATPRSQFGNGTEELGTGASSSATFCTYGRLTEIISPTAEDHILDCALLFKRIKGDGQLVVLSNSITLKIKAMAEGLLCETPKEFRASLLDPYSKRFMWSDSSPRGSTWSCIDEAAKIEDYYHQFPDVRRTPKPIDCVKGLKLILLHNYHYGKTNLVK